MSLSRLPINRVSTRRAIVAAAAGFAFAPLASGARAQSTPVAGQRTVETMHGSVSVPANPKRIVAVNFVSVLTLLELGLIPVGRTEYVPHLPAGYPDIEAISVVVSGMGEVDLEKIISLKPDLIVGSDVVETADQTVPYAELSRIAPTAIFEWTSAAGNWAVEAAGVAEATGKTADLAKPRETYETHADTIQKTYADQLAAITWDVINAADGNWYLYGPDSSHGEVAKRAGIRFGAAKDQTEGYAEYSYEQLDRLKDTGALLVQRGEYGTDVLNTLPVYTTLPAVRAGHEFPTDFFFRSSYGLANALLDDIEAGLANLAKPGA